ncbi:TetR/AcrR family transcriptional regulator [Cumulibacter soli]|uniref:TetR/AcrR family transcriptional regulator n=1 Tax=Cumulibacter soli TaxID=2546344 RepID=UPI00141A086F|nr:TetR/AcrR family transcriptional regulator [Cumulibacter soli]
MLSERKQSRPGRPPKAVDLQAERNLREAATRAFAEKGFDGVSIRELADRAGLSLSMLYYYYRSKQDLLRTILIDSIEQYFAQHEALMSQASSDPVDRLAKFVEGSVRYRIDSQVESRLMLTATRNLGAEWEQYDEQVTSRTNRDLGGIIELGIAEQLFSTPYPSEARRSIIATCNSIAFWYQAGRELSADDIVQRHIRLALNAVEYVGEY